ncbi:PREDICTED: abnormal spindle-like microcephaly-associated protein homolog isoform X3 [Lupinus angustifolius]|uniref:abnormal spindle-like microcephaly-associated protein homolog isoform X3 n=1 Tax=Lupinus angustifolius TaxID=3871 RepID=UPI00092E9481|nr:PREDICTED: abnormal spindle-like microcephaly-associated protein homolog isoform X3 [Lupinus angustifolius]
MDAGDEAPSPFPLLKDISNFRTPRRPPLSLTVKSPSTTSFFTASKQTPRSSSTFRRRPPNKHSTAAARKLNAFQLEQSQSSRKALIKKEQSLKSLAKSLTVWLNFLLQNPSSCGCHVSISEGVGSAAPLTNGKRDSAPGVSVGVDSTWRIPKRQRKTCSRDEKENCTVSKENGRVELPYSTFSNLKESLKDVCSFDDLKQRMKVYLSLSSCKEIFQTLNPVAKAIDDGRLTLKAHCPIVTDVGLKDKATRILMCYNPIWLRIGLYIIFGGDSLLLNGKVDSDEDVVFLRMVIDKLFFSHEGLAKQYVYNKMVEGVYRSGYYENLGKVILKRILLLVLFLDRAKCQSCLPLEYGIDGLDGGSPLLFKAESWIKSSNQVIHEFLSSDVMHGEGNLLAHLVILRYKVSHQQGSLVEYDFNVSDLFVDLQDGIKLCRAIQLLQHNSSIIMKIAVPSDTTKKKMANCVLALQYLRQAGVSLQDEDGMMIVADDLVNGDKELTLSMLWNMFVHLQLPLLVDKRSLAAEISKIRGLSTDLTNSANCSSLELLLNWIRAVCENYGCEVDNFRSLVDGKAIWCILDYYFQKVLHDSGSLKEVKMKSVKSSIVSVHDYSDALYNFILSQKLATLLGNFPEVLQISELLEYNGACNDHSVVILLVFLASQLFVKKNVDHLNFHKLLGFDCHSPYRRHLRMVECLSSSKPVQNPDASDVLVNEDATRKFRAIQAWWQDMAERNQILKPAISDLQTSKIIECSTNIRRENAARTIQSHIRGLVVRHKFLKVKNAVSLLQTVFRAWLKVRLESRCLIPTTIPAYKFSHEILRQPETYQRYAMLFVHRHSFLRLKRSTQLIQQRVRSWLCWRHQRLQGCSIKLMASDPVTAATIVQKFVRGWIARSGYIRQLNQKDKALYLAQKKVILDLQINAALTIQHAWKKFKCCKSTQKQHYFATKIQCNFRRWLSRKRFLQQIQSVVKIQSSFRMWRCIKAFQHFKIAFKAAIVIQSCLRGWLARKKAYAHKNHVVEIQRQCRGWLVKRDFLLQTDAVVKIQCVIRSLKCQKALDCQKVAASKIQCFIRGHLSRNRLLGGASQLCAIIPVSYISRPIGCCSFQLELYLTSVKKLQRWWKGILLLKIMNKSAIVIQSCTRGWIARQKSTVHRHLIAPQALYCQNDAALKIQCFIRGHLTRNLLLGNASKLHAVIPAGLNSRPIGCYSFQLELFLISVVRLQRWWKRVLLRRLMTKSAIIIQSCARGWMAKRKATIHRHNIAVIQSCWKGYLARKESKQQLLDLRLRLQESARNVEDSKRLINRLLAALSELLNMKSVSDILHTCSTLDMATGYSQKCCEELVAAGAIVTLLRLTRSLSRSKPDQEVLKHALSTLRNLARYPHLLQVLIQTRDSLQIVVMELLRNKEDGYFIASELLKKICSTHIGAEALLKSPALLKRLHGLVEELTRKAVYEKRNTRDPSPIIRENKEWRLKEVVE